MSPYRLQRLYLFQERYYIQKYSCNWHYYLISFVIINILQGTCGFCAGQIENLNMTTETSSTI